MPDFQSALSALSQQYGEVAKIPYDPLYEYLTTYKTDLLTIPRVDFEGSSLYKRVTWLCKTDLFWMARYFTWETNPACAGEPVSSNRVTLEEYKVICDFFVKKDPRKPINEQDEIKNRLLLWPRGGYKSTIDEVDVAQWILCFPDIRILYLTGAKDLAVKFVTETKGHFVSRPADPTLMNVFFPEFCIPENDKENQYEFTCPAWAAKKISRGEPTVLASAVGATKAGTHFELIKADDAVSDKNSETIEQCQTISQKLSLAKRLLRLGGFYMEFIGTRYHDEDHYGNLLEKSSIGTIETTKLGPCVDLVINKDTATKVLIGRGIVLKTEAVQKLQAEGRPVNYKEAGPDGCDLLIPKVMPYPWLIKEWSENEIVFEGQINQNPRPSSTTVFERKDLIAATCQFNACPQGGPITQTWDFAFSARAGRDFSVCSTVRWNDKSQFFLMDLVRKRVKFNELAQEVVDAAVKWCPQTIGIENAGNAEAMAPAILSKALATGRPEVIAVCSKIDWIRVDTSADSKRTRMGMLHPPLMEGRFKIVGSYFDPILLEEIYKEFERCMTSKSGRNDIPDVISQQLRYAPQMAMMIDKKELSTWSQSDAEWNLMFENGDAFGRPGWAVPVPMVNVQPEPEIDTRPYADGLPNILGAGLNG